MDNFKKSLLLINTYLATVSFFVSRRSSARSERRKELRHILLVLHLLN